MLESLNLRNTEIVTLLKNIAENVCFKVMLYFMLHGLQFFFSPLSILHCITGTLLTFRTHIISLHKIYLTQINVVVKIM